MPVPACTARCSPVSKARATASVISSCPSRRAPPRASTARASRSATGGDSASLTAAAPPGRDGPVRRARRARPSHGRLCRPSATRPGPRPDRSRPESCRPAPGHGQHPVRLGDLGALPGRMQEFLSHRPGRFGHPQGGLAATRRSLVRTAFLHGYAVDLHHFVDHARRRRPTR